MADLVPTQATDQLGVVDNPWAQLHCGTGFLRAIQLVATPSTHAQYGTFSLANSRWLHLRSDGILYLGTARIAYHNDFAHTRDQFLLFMGHEAGTGVSGAYPHVPPMYDTLYSVALALQAHDTSLTSLDTRVSALENGGDDCCDIALNEISDVVITGPSDGQALVYDVSTSTWINGTIETATSLSALSDVTLTEPSYGQALVYDLDTGTWINRRPPHALGSEGWLQAASPGNDGTFMPTAVRFTFMDGVPYSLEPIQAAGTSTGEDPNDIMRAVNLGAQSVPFARLYLSSPTIEVATADGASQKLGVTYTEERIVPGLVPTSFTLAHSVLMVGSEPSHPQHISVTVNGVAQAYGADYNVNGSTVTWASGDFSLELGDVLTFTYTGA